VNPVFGRFLKMTGRDLRLVAAHGTTLIDTDGRAFDDWVAGFGTFNLGHNPEVVCDAMHDAIDSGAPNLFSENVNPAAGALAEALTRAAGAPFEIASFSNSGSEAVEAAVQTAVRATGRTRIVYADRAYHGVVFERHMRNGAAVAFGDAEALRDTLANEDVAAFILEPVQMEGGVRVASCDYVRRVAELCRSRGTLLLFDEVQTGMGRSGQLFAFRTLGVTPDIVILAKALGGGMMPIGAMLASRETWMRAWGTYLQCEAQNTTFGGNNLACRAALAALQAIDTSAFLANVRARGEDLSAALHARIGHSPFVERISFLGLMGGIALRDPAHPWLNWNALGLEELDGMSVSAPLVVDRLHRAGILAQVCANDWSVLRIEPPLVVSGAVCARFVDAVGEAVDWLETNA
jgi:acetylornithine/succinyldiaminopimelate/putrescine aminotransferase